MTSRLAFADLHLEEKSAPTVWEVLKRIPQECAQRKITNVIFLGDFFMVRHTVPVWLLLELHDILRSWRDTIERFDVVIGNHDQISASNDRNVLEIFRDLPFAKIHSEPTWTEHGLMMPWRASQQEALDVLSHPVPDGCDNVLWAHLAMKGALMNNTHANEDGLDSDVVMKHFRRAFLGHYHKPQLVRKGMLYVGSPWQVTYAEAGQPKGFIVWDGKKHEHVEWRIGRRHHKVEIDADNPSTQAMDLSSVEPGDKLWIKIRGQMANAMKGSVEAAVKAAGVSADRIEVDLRPIEQAARLEMKPTDTLADVAGRFLAAQEMEESFKLMLLDAWARMAP